MRSKIRKSQILFVLATIILVAIIYFLLGKYDDDEHWLLYYILYLSIGMICLLVAVYIYMFLTGFPRKTRSLKQLIRIGDTIQNYSEKMHNDDIQILTEILKINNINTRPKVQEAIRHYQCLLPRKVSSSGQLLAILAFSISIMTLMFSEPFLYSSSNREIIFFILAVITLLYGIIHLITSDILKIFGKTALYTRLESSLSEIFMMFYLKKTNHKITKMIKILKN